MKLIVLQGIPGSGKSHRARKLLKENEGEKLVIVNRDNIRSMLGKYWVPNREPLVTILEDEMISNSLIQGYSVIVDATNLSPATIKRLKRLTKVVTPKADIEFIQIKASIAKAFLQIIWRKLFGGRFIKLSVVKSFYKRYSNIIGI